MTTANEIRERAIGYVKSNPREVRLLGFLAAFALVWMGADAIQSFVTGFFDGVYQVRQQ